MLMRDTGQKTRKNMILCEGYLRLSRPVVFLFVMSKANLILDPRACSPSTGFSIFLDAC